MSRITLEKMNKKIWSFWRGFSEKDLRDDFVSSHLGSRLAAQIYSLRKARGMTQAELAMATGTKQSGISRLEESCEAATLSTLKKLASAFDVALIVRFVPYSVLLRSAIDPADCEKDIPSYAEDSLPVAMPAAPSSLTLTYTDRDKTRWSVIQVGHHSSPTVSRALHVSASSDASFYVPPTLDTRVDQHESLH
jgi:transcriptional regulator with XRE-family HTH domain